MSDGCAYPLLLQWVQFLETYPPSRLLTKRASALQHREGVTARRRTGWSFSGIFQALFLARFLRESACFVLASRRSTSSFDTLNILRTALSIRSASVLPGT
jgi:hypothetical protein